MNLTDNRKGFLNGDGFIERLLPTQDNTNTEETQKQVYAPSGIQTPDPCIQPNEDSISPRPLNF
jgi:hypothetical protein